MRHYYTADEIREAEAPLLASLPDGGLMRRAAFGLATAIARELALLTGGISGRQICAVVGSGDNGGDALWAATFLRRRGAAAAAVLLSPERTHLSFAPYHWRDSIGFAPVQRAQWSYALGSRASLGMSVANVRDFITEPVYGAEVRQYGVIGRYSFAPDWSLSAESIAREPNTLFRLQDFRIGVRRQF